MNQKNGLIYGGAAPIRAMAWVSLLLTAGCAAFDSVSLPGTDGLLLDTQALASEVAAPTIVNVSDGLDLLEVATIAVVTNPELIAVRKGLQVSEAQLFGTRLFPDPQLSASIDRPTGNTTGLVNANSLSLNYDVLSLLTRGPDVRSQRMATEQVRLDLIWQEWQVAQQARILFVRDRQETEKLELLGTTVENFRQRQASSAHALDEGNLTINDAGPDLTALLDAQTQLRQLEQQHNQTQHELKALLGLAPEAVLVLEPLPKLPEKRSLQKSDILDHVIRTRPDLLALQAGYASQEARLRSAVLRLFPSLAVGFSRARDTGNISTSGVGISLDLPFFSGSRGDVRIQKATREQLFAEYQARLARLRSDISRLATEQEILDRHKVFLRAHIPELQRMSADARSAYASRDIDALTYLNLELSAINKRIELIDLEQALWEISIALDTVTARSPLQ